jgi:SHS2 domain-containing protein
MALSGWQHFEHKADIGVRGSAATLEEAFVQTALAMTAVITDLDTVAADEVVEIECSAPDNELLLVDWLNALIYEMAVRRMLFSRFEVKIDKGSLRGRARGELVEVARHHPAVEIKGATYTELKVAQENGLWIAQCVLDV